MEIEEAKNALDLIVNILRRIDEANPSLPATFIYNEGWMLRLVLQSIQDGVYEGILSPFETSINWTSEALLATPFSENRGRAFEGLTNADGVIGNFLWRPGTSDPLRLTKECKRCEIIEAKMHSSLSKGVKSAPWYDQAVRNVACLAHALQIAGISTNDIGSLRLGFRVIAPEMYINAGRFQDEMSPETMRAKIRMRIGQFHGSGLEQLEQWRANYFEPLLNNLVEKNLIGCLSWESMIESITCKNRKAMLKEFYSRCLDPFSFGVNSAIATDIVRGVKYELLDRPGVCVVVCDAGRQRSRVFEPSSSGPSFLVENRLLRLTDDKSDFLDVPEKSEIRELNDKMVMILSVGPCRSKVQFVDDLSVVEYVDNHRLRKPSSTENESEIC